MNSVEHLLLDLVRVGESPLHTSYRWVGRKLGRDMTLDAFLRLVGDLVAQDVLRLWSVDMSADRTELFAVPSDLIRRYQDEAPDDESYDPFGLSLTLGVNADSQAPPDWEVDLDFEGQGFVLRARSEHEALALDTLSRYYPSIRFSTINRAVQDDHVQIVGTIEEKQAHEGSTSSLTPGMDRCDRPGR